MWVDINGSKFNTDNLVAIRPVDDGDEQCVIFTSGQSATDGGFLIDLPLDEVFSLIQQARLMEIAGMLAEPSGGENEGEEDEEDEEVETEKNTASA